MQNKHAEHYVNNLKEKYATHKKQNINIHTYIFS